MNERIQELAEQCWVRVPYYPAGNDGHPEYNTVFSQEKFAELIVRECAEVVQEGRWMVPPSQEQLARSIKEHFGVEQ